MIYVASVTASAVAETCTCLLCEPPSGIATANHERPEGAQQISKALATLPSALRRSAACAAALEAKAVGCRQDASRWGTMHR